MTNQELIKQLKSYRKLESGGQPQDFWVASNKELLMSQIQPRTSYNQAVTDKPSEATYYVEFFNLFFKQKILKPALATFMIVAVMLSYTATVSVANASLPGDMLYPVKTASEKVQLALTYDEEKKVELQMDFVGRRVDELQQIVKQEDNTQVKKDKVVQTVQKISQDIKEVNNKLKTIHLADAKLLAAVAKDVDEKASQIKQEISKVHAEMPEDIKKDVAKDMTTAIDDTEKASDDALEVVLAKYLEGQEEIDSQEIVTRLANRIKDLEAYTLVVSATSSVAATSSTPAVSTSTQTLEATASSSQSLTETKEDDQRQQLKVLIEEAKDLLDQNNFEQVLAKIQASKTIVNAMKQVPAEVVIKVEDQAEAVSTTTTTQTIDILSQTSTPVLKDTNIQAGIEVNKVESE